VVTAKDKLRGILSKGLGPEAATLAAERARDGDEMTRLAGYASAPTIYSAEVSLFVLALGAALVREGRADLLYLSTTDFVQHTHAPDEPEALNFYAGIDRRLGELEALGVVVGVTADHGMSAKTDATGAPRVVYLTPILRESDPGARVILPITDPYVAHHASLGSFAVVHLSSPGLAGDAMARLLRTEGVTEVLPREQAARLMELPADRLGDLVVVSGRGVALGTSPEEHDLRQLAGSSLRSHGGRYEEMVPLIFSRPMRGAYRRAAGIDPRNFDAFEFTLNGTDADATREGGA
jgi:phosphonoacetate hydrolase